jgi:hypothetical protein
MLAPAAGGGVGSVVYRTVEIVVRVVVLAQLCGDGQEGKQTLLQYSDSTCSIDG